MIIFPMAGKSSRFFNAGYTSIKYKLKLGEESLFHHSVKSFQKYFSSDHFIFILPYDSSDQNYIKYETEKLGILNYTIVTLKKETRGQAETVYLALKEINIIEEIYIFNIDTILLDFSKSYENEKTDAYLEFFIGEGNHWSFAELTNQNEVLRVVEKERISKFCSNGLYYFRNSQVFCEVFEDNKRNNILSKGEFFIAPLYNNLILKNLIVKAKLIDLETILFSGTPEEYESLKSKF